MTGFASPNFGERRGGVRPSLIVLHYTAMPSCAEARARLCDPVWEVSAHWLISETGAAEQLVDEQHRAWHAGAGEWAGISDVNSHSIGIELANTGDAPFPEPQMTALESLLAGIMARWAIAPHRIIAHSDMAPTRKSDPGRHFDWRRLARSGLSVWPTGRLSADPAGFLPSLHRFGYAPADAAALTDAFRQRFLPWAKGPVTAAEAGMAADLAHRFPAKPVDVPPRSA